MFRAVMNALLATLLAATACSSREERPATRVPTAMPTVAPGGLVPWEALPLPDHPVAPAPSTLVPHLVAPAAGMAGSDVLFEVVLRNGASQPYAPRDCPVFVAWLQRAGDDLVHIAGEPLTLNCLPGLPIAPGGEARFAMELRIPQSTPPGAWMLSWGFAAITGAYGTVAQSPIAVASGP